MDLEFGQGLASRYEVSGSGINTNTQVMDILGTKVASPQSQEDREVIVRLISGLL